MTITRLRYVLAVCVLCMFSCYPANSRAGLIPVRGAIEGAPGQNTADSDGVYQASAKKLDGSVYIASQKETALAMVLVEELDPGWNHVLGSARTDYQGHFKLKPARRGKKHYLRLSAQGFSTREYEITLSKDSPAELKLELQVAANSGAPA